MIVQLLNARFIVTDEKVESIKQNLPDKIEGFCAENRSELFSLVDHKALPDGSRLDSEQSYVTIRLRVIDFTKELRQQFEKVAAKIAPQLGVELHATYDFPHLIDGLTSARRS